MEYVVLAFAPAMFLLGYAVGSKKRETPKQHDPSVCSCKHNYSVHDSKGKCHQQMFNLDGYTTSKSYTCYCQRYDGIAPAHVFMNED